MTVSTEEILIAGGGIGGLCLALSLAKLGHRSHILEARPAFSAAGAGIQLGPNATAVLASLGVGVALADVATQPEAIVVGDGRTGGRLAELPLGPWVAARHRSPYVVVHRAALQDVLAGAVANTPLVDVTFDFAVTDISERGDGVEVQDAGGARRSGSVLVGADGVWSRVRRFVAPDHETRPIGLSAARAVLPRNDVPTAFRRTVTGVWLAPSTHVVHYPVDEGDAVAIVVIAADDTTAKEWSITTSNDHVRRVANRLDTTLGPLLERPETWRRWALFDAKPLQRWHTARTALLGDAAHPILPFLAQGGAMAIEDAAVLAHCLVRRNLDPVHALSAYAAVRQPRVSRVQAASRQNGVIYHHTGAMAAARNAVLRAVPGRVLMKRFDWLYGWTPPSLSGVGQ